MEITVESIVMKLGAHVFVILRSFVQIGDVLNIDFGNLIFGGKKQAEENDIMIHPCYVCQSF